MLGLWREMQRRHVLRIAGVYVAVGWVFIEILANVLPMFEAPLWIGKTLTLILVLCFPVALIIAWAFEITPDGIKYDDREPDRDEVMPSALPDYLIFFALTVVIFFNFVDFGEEEPKTELTVVAGDIALAVLPFVDFSEGGSNQYLGNGISEAVLNALAGVEGLRVASRTSSFAAQNRDLNVQDIGQRLNVDQVLEGSIRRRGNKLRVSTQLSNATTGFQVWSNNYDREFDDIFEIEEDIARSLVVALKGRMALDDTLVLQTGTRNIEAYNLAQRGRYYFDLPSSRNFETAKQLFQDAIELDPEISTVHGYLAFCIGYSSIYTDYAEQAAAAAISAELALRQDPGDIPALVIKGFMFRDTDLSYPYYKQALESGLERDLVLTTYHNDYLWPQTRQAEVKDVLEVALKDNPDSVLLLHPLAMVESSGGNFDAALKLAARAGATDGSSFLVSTILADVYLRSGDAKKLKQVAEQSISMIGEQNGFISHYLVKANVLSGDLARANVMMEKMLEKRDRGTHWSATTIGLGLAAVGRYDDAVSWLVQANRERDFWLRWHLRSAVEDYPELATHDAVIALLADMGLDDDSIKARIEAGR